MEKKLRNAISKNNKKNKKLKLRVDNLLEYVADLEITYISEQLVENAELTARVFKKKNKLYLWKKW